MSVTISLNGTNSVIVIPSPLSSYLKYCTWSDSTSTSVATCIVFNSSISPVLLLVAFALIICVAPSSAIVSIPVTFVISRLLNLYSAAFDCTYSPLSILNW